MPASFHGGIRQNLKLIGAVPKLIDINSEYGSEKTTLPPLSGTLDTLSPEELISRFEEAKVRSLAVGDSLPSLCREAVARSREKRIRLIVDCTSPTDTDFAYHSAVMYKTHELMSGIRLLMRATHATESIIIIDNSRVPVIRRLEKECDGNVIRHRVCESKHPMHDKKLLVYLAVTRELSFEESPLLYGCAVVDAETCISAYEAAVHGVIKDTRLVSVNARKKYAAFLPYGMPISEIPEIGEAPFATDSHPMPSEIGADAVICGSTRSVYRISPALSLASDCIGCAFCEDACPMYLPVMGLVNAKGKKLPEVYSKHKFDACILCGSCSAVCPSGIELRNIIKEVRPNE